MAIIKRNFTLKILAVALAIVGWAYFRFATNPLLAARFDQQLSVPITTINLPVDLVAHFNDRDAVVTVEAPRGQPPVKPDEVKAVLDLSGKATGVYNVPVALVAPSVVVQSLSPASVALTIERIDQKSFALEPHYLGTQSGIVVGSVAVAPTTATVRGADSLLGQVMSLRLEIPVPTVAGSIDEMLRPVPVDSLGEEVDGVQVSPELVRVQIRFDRGGARTQ
jgi:YbbR domain-containing protein